MKYRSFWKPLDRAELPVLEKIREVRKMGPMNTAARVLTEAGQYGAIWYGVAGVAAWRDEKRRDQWIAAGAKVGAIYAANTLLKVAAKRQRPPIAEIGTPTGLSFPSSHAVTCFAAARLYSELVPAASPVLYAGAAGIASTRLHFLVHYPSDVIVGAALGEAAARALSATPRS